MMRVINRTVYRMARDKILFSYCDVITKTGTCRRVGDVVSTKNTMLILVIGLALAMSLFIPGVAILDLTM